MNEQPRSALRNLIAEYGLELARDPARLGGMLRDDVGEHKREINVILDAMNEQVADDLLEVSSTPIEVLVSGLVQRLARNRGTNLEAAQWAVDTWALALGRTTSASRPTNNATSSSSPEAEPAMVRVAATPVPPPQSSPQPVRPTLVDRLLGLVRDDQGKPRYVVLGGVLAAALAAMFAASGGSQPRINKIELAGTTFTGDSATVVQLIGDNRNYSAQLYFEDRDGDVVTLEQKMIDGKFPDGSVIRLVPLKVDGQKAGAFTLPISTRERIPSRMQLRLIDRQGKSSDTFVVCPRRMDQDFG